MSSSSREWDPKAGTRERSENRDAPQGATKAETVHSLNLSIDLRYLQERGSRAKRRVGQLSFPSLPPSHLIPLSPPCSRQLTYSP